MTVVRPKCEDEYNVRNQGHGLNQGERMMHSNPCRIPFLAEGRCLRTDRAISLSPLVGWREGGGRAKAAPMGGWVFGCVCSRTPT